MSEWTYIKIGDRRPEGRVLVAYTDETDLNFLRAVYGHVVPKEYVTIASWNKSKSVWVTDHWYIRTVYAWMPLPAPPTEASDDQ
jgi:hypothetical protein